MNKQIELEKLAEEFIGIDVLTIAKKINEQIAAVMLKNEDPTEEEVVEIMEELRNALPDNEKIMSIVRTTPLLKQDGPMCPYFFNVTSKILTKWINPTERMLAVVKSFADAYKTAWFFLDTGSGANIPMPGLGHVVKSFADAYKTAWFFLDTGSGANIPMPGLGHIQAHAKIDMLRHIVALTVFAKQMDLSFISKEHEFSNRLALCPLQMNLHMELFGLFAKIESCFEEQVKGQNKQQEELADIMFALIQENKEQICKFAETIKGIVGHNFVNEAFATVFEKMVELSREERVWLPFNSVRHHFEKLDIGDIGTLFFAMSTAAIKMDMAFAMNGQAN